MLYLYPIFTMDKSYLKNIIIFIFILLLSSGCTQKDPTFTLLEIEPEDEWNSRAYQKWLKGR